MCVKVRENILPKWKLNISGGMWSRLSFIEKKPSAFAKILKDLIEKSQNLKIFDLGQELVLQAHLKAQWSNFFKDLNWIKTNYVYDCFTSQLYSKAISGRIFHLFWFNLNIWRNHFIELVKWAGGTNSWPRSKIFRFWDFSIRSFKFLSRRLVFFRYIPV